MKWWLLLACLLVTLLTAWLILYAGVALSTLVSLGLGAISLLWLLVILTVPWNLCFTARHVVHEIQVSREAGIEVARHREEEAGSIARRMLALAISGHVVSAVVIAIITYFSGAQVGYYFAAFYLLATCFRPIGAYTSHLRDRIKTLGREVRYPRADVLALRDQVAALHATTERLEREFTRLTADLAAARHGLELADHDLGRRMTLMTRRFDETVDGLADNHEVITGLKAFLRLVRADPA
ncbi:hypothetical protein ETD86_22955 [Nonomuraea turkmeniaca]|uniref:Uncharacterized protein n=1 Tax=Nonomuraea turkmeniaca TaxID=103838 RepID=A0A5S4FF87_9ACTN|nr:hypothetical protein [Nonomuraea turkmeniaca]TMR17654.1 hypothetical protein ETD86_22955 [Nonomuraea turkmeniaca]